MSKSLIQRIRQLKESVGTSINDAELTSLIIAGSDTLESGFRFLSFCNGFALFDVPKQDIAKWYSKDGWLSQEKKQILDAIARRLGLEIVQPPDYPKMDISSTQHHHFELYAGTRNVITIHPKFLKVLIMHHPVIPEEDLLSHLHSLYE